MNESSIAGGGRHAGLAASASPFARYSDADVTALIREYPLAWLCPAGDDPALPTLLPLLVETDAAGHPTSLLGHIARRNPLVATLEKNREALVLFAGPQAYVSPAHVTDPAWAPTWNYAQVRIAARVTFDPAGGGAAIQALIDAIEEASPSGWNTMLMGERYAPMERQIIAFSAEILRIEGRFKLGQDESGDRLREILDCHPDADLVRWMRRFNAGRF